MIFSYPKIEKKPGGKILKREFMSASNSAAHIFLPTKSLPSKLPFFQTHEVNRGNSGGAI
jgi:hypothetical protein